MHTLLTCSFSREILSREKLFIAHSDAPVSTRRAPDRRAGAFTCGQRLLRRTERTQHTPCRRPARSFSGPACPAGRMVASVRGAACESIVPRRGHVRCCSEHGSAAAPARWRQRYKWQRNKRQRHAQLGHETGVIEIDMCNHMVAPTPSYMAHRCMQCDMYVIMHVCICTCMYTCLGMLATCSNVFLNVCTWYVRGWTGVGVFNCMWVGICKDTGDYAGGE